MSQVSVLLSKVEFVITLITFWFMYPLMMRDAKPFSMQFNRDRSGNLLSSSCNRQRATVCPLLLGCVLLKKPDSPITRMATNTAVPQDDEAGDSCAGTRDCCELVNSLKSPVTNQLKWFLLVRWDR